MRSGDSKRRDWGTTRNPDWDNKAGSVLEQSHVPGTKLEDSQIELGSDRLTSEFQGGAYVAKFCRLGG